ncbi:MAG: DUF4003 family protein [Clostridia bacterium]|nr:DUF4003 family protein [Clostridia bacterium]
MELSLQSRCEKFTENRNILKESFRWDSQEMYLLVSTLYTLAGKTADAEKLRDCEKLIKEETGTFSGYRGHIRHPLAARMAMSADPKAYLDGVKILCDMLSGNRSGASVYKIISAMVLMDHTGCMTAEDEVEDTLDIFGRMKKEHPLLTKDEDMPFAALLAASKADIDCIGLETEECYEILRHRISNNNAVQSLSHVLALSGNDCEEKCDKLMKLSEELRIRNKDYGRDHELAVLGALTITELSAEEAAERIKNADDYIKSATENISEEHRMMYAAMLVLEDEEIKHNMAASEKYGDFLCRIILLEMAIIIMMLSLIETFKED